MVSDRRNIDSIIVDLCAKREKLRSDLRSLDAAIENLQSIAGITNAAFNEISVEAGESPFEGLTKPQMAKETLCLSQKPMTTREILDFWIKNGRAPKGSNREASVRKSLREREKSPGDVLHLGGGKWGLREWHTPDEVQEIMDRVAGKDLGRARDHEEHVKKTVEGIRKAQEKGVYVGAPPKITPEQWDLAVCMADSGESLREIHRQIQAKLTPDGGKAPSYQAIHLYSEDIKSGAPYPSKWKAFYDAKRNDEKERCSKIRVVK